MAAGDVVFSADVRCRKAEDVCDETPSDGYGPLIERWNATLSGAIGSDEVEIVVTRFKPRSSSDVSARPIILQCAGGPQYRLTITEI